jgi:hypothetical protein
VKYPASFNHDSLNPALSKGENGQENPLIIFTHISFYSVGNGIGKVRNGIWLAKSDQLKMDKSE